MKAKALCALAAASLALLAVSGPSQAQNGGIPDYPDVIQVERGGFTPEGIEYDLKNQRFLLGSVVEGRVYAVDSDGAMEVLVDDPDLMAAVGIEVDEERNRLLVVNADASVFGSDARGFAEAGIYDLDSGERLAMVDLSGAYDNPPEDTRFFPNDLVVDEAGDIYVTDSFAAVIYKIDGDYQPSIFVPRDRFKEGEQLNGILAHPDGYLLVAGPGTGTLYKVAGAGPRDVSQVEIGEMIAADGMVWAGSDSIAAVGRGRTVLLRSEDNWRSARISGQAEQGQASTAAAVGDEIYIVYPHFADQQPPTIERVEFSQP